MKPRISLTFPAILLLAACAATQVPQRSASAAASAEATLAEVKRIDLQRQASLVAADLPRLRELLADNLTYCHSNGSCESGSSLLGRVAAGELKYLKLESTGLQAEQAGDVVLLHGQVNMQAQNGPQTVGMSLSYLAVYEQRAGRWQLRAYQSTRMP